MFSSIVIASALLFVTPAFSKASICRGLNKTQCTVWRAVNEERSKRRVSELTVNVDCQKMAQSHAQDMAENLFFSHVSPSQGSFSERSDRFDIGGYIAENIAMGHTPLEAVRAWMNSRGHFKNIVNKKYAGTGIGHAVDERGRSYYVQCFSGEK